jgi:low temperature requirement protein LtrA
VAGVANGLHDARWAASAVPVAALCFVLAAALWWSYFDLAGARAKRLLNRSGGERSDHSHDVYVFGQLPLTLALAMIGAGIELAVVQSGQGEVPAGTRLLLAGGVALYLVSVTVIDIGMADRARIGWWWPLGAAAVALVDAAIDLPAVVVVGALAALFVAVVVAGMAERSTGRLAVDQI